MAEMTFERAKALYELGVNSQRSGQFVHAARVFEILAAGGDPFYTPFALAALAQCYSSLQRKDFELEAFKRVIRLPRDEQQVLNPGWLVLAYQRVGDFGRAKEIVMEVMTFTPNDPGMVSAYAELSLLTGDLDEAHTAAGKLRSRAEPTYIVLGRMIDALVFGLRGSQAQSLEELNWIALFIISSGSAPVGQWNYDDLQPLIARLGANVPAATLLTDVLSGRKTVPDLIDAWKTHAPAA